MDRRREALARKRLVAPERSQGRDKAERGQREGDHGPEGRDDDPIKGRADPANGIETDGCQRDGGLQLAPLQVSPREARQASAQAATVEQAEGENDEGSAMPKCDRPDEEGREEGRQRRRA